MNKRVEIGGANGELVAQPCVTGNRHGLVSGATGTGKTVTLQVLAEGFARSGTPVFITDVKGDLTGVAAAGKPHKEVDRRLGEIPLPAYQQRGYPVVFWDIFAKHGHPVRTTLSEMGPLVLSNLLQLNDTQTGVLYAAFAIADDEGMLLLDLKDLRAMLLWMSENAKTLRAEYGNIAAASVGAIQRRLLVLEEQGAEQFFGEPAISVQDLMQVDNQGIGFISVLRAVELLRDAPRLYAAFLIWLLSELFETLPEVGDPDTPVLVLFFDEAHLLFKSMPKSLLEKIEQVVRLVRSKGVGVYFATQNPLDIPEAVLGQLGLKVQHGMRAFTPKDRKTLRAIEQGFRNDEGLDLISAITQLGLGEALVSVLDERGVPSSAAITLIKPPESRIGPIAANAQGEVISQSPFKGVYDTVVDRESAYEMLAQRAEQAVEPPAPSTRTRRQSSRSAPRRSNRQGVMEAMLKSAARSVGRSIGSKLVRGILGSLLKR